MDIHTAVSGKMGLSRQEIGEIFGDDVPQSFVERERLAMQLADEVCKTPANVPESLYSELARALGEEELIELASVIAHENARARFNRVFDIGSDNLCELDQPR
jgi:alkylhydroperoxidase family enzyme